MLPTTGNAAGTGPSVDGAAVALPGGAGAVRRDVPLDPDPEALKADAAKAGDAPKAGRMADRGAGQPEGRPAAPASTSRPLAQ